MSPLLAFDLDGTLIDSAQDITTALNSVFAEYKLPLVQKHDVIPFIGTGPRQLIVSAFNNENLSEDEHAEIYHKFISNYHDVMLSSTRPYDGAIDFLKSYPGPIGIITNKPINPTRKILNHLELDRLPWVEVLGADSLPEKKPSPLPLQVLMKKAQRDPKNCIMIGDGIPDMESGRNAGVQIIAAAYGYTELDLLKKYQPNQILHTFTELPNLLKKMS